MRTERVSGTNAVFEKTIRSLGRFRDFSAQLKAMFRDQGISAAANIVESKLGVNYVSFPDGALLESLAYLNRISYDEFNTNGAPLLHFCACEEFQRLYNSHSPHLLLIAPRSNAFEFSVYRGHSMVGWYADTPLRLCPMCKEIFANLWRSQPTAHLENLKNMLDLPLL